MLNSKKKGDKKLLVMKDRDIRAQLRLYLMAQHEGDANTILLDELGLCQGESRVDMAVVNGSLNGYEIKSERDTLSRLPVQQNIYGKTLDTVTIVTGSNHLMAVLEKVPIWWGVIEACNSDYGVELKIVREGRQNQTVDSYSVLQLLWRDEAYEELEQRGLSRGLKGKPRHILWRKLAESLTQQEVSEAVRRQLKSRTKWRVD
jgi:hypothetical protein